MTVARALQTATLLAGTVPAAREVLVAGGDGAGASAEVYDPGRGSSPWPHHGDGALPPDGHAPADGTCSSPAGPALGALSSAELWAPAADRGSPAAQRADGASSPSFRLSGSTEGALPRNFTKSSMGSTERPFSSRSRKAWAVAGSKSPFSSKAEKASASRTSAHL